ncbi:hypothetical protein A3C23_01480 [Candidatus Roizmanbacteria bacterium RIFCSPHIGHO2_02_FULL_37_13b]|uniref:PD-(D/E)XK endonuclease-like domain-containing protein n=1 Tax=Candidatus Roizmanbacteria bacterium RIFCSPLOWO2_02_FULL_36_11 TaxID=1802071 RepID=A0A1F7JIH1_9BACT|nr:MAG: hypothetical protein A3C23_01480 [Candidatus Roizmanbacteria bacterium RIFCSPHIGHO2_02_FULL_37_13b]OGK55409.1 MAG: hypothetical protein A3H78_05950 [Candidatus Roizmanbacteria bacterium RIFCSPLOWO2_02_FULL_36_11]
MFMDKYQAIWLSYSSIKDFLNCQRSYYYKNIYKNPKTGRKIAITKPSLSLGQAVHDVIEEISKVAVDQRFDIPLMDRYKKSWQKVTGLYGGFRSKDQENDYFIRGELMIKLLTKHPGPLVKKTIKIKEKIPYYWFSSEDNMILCGKIDWLEFLEKTNSIHIIDFKTGKSDEREDSLQLPIYYLVAKNCQNRPITKVSYWYLDRESKPTKILLLTEDQAEKAIKKVAERIKLARQLNHFKCAIDEKEGCRYCAPLKAVIEGKGKFVRLGDFGEEIYYLPDEAVSL